MNLFDISGKKVIITGGVSGLGKGMTEGFLEAGASVAVIDISPSGRWGTPDDVKGVVLFLASDASDYISGAIIPVDSGYLGC